MKADVTLIGTVFLCCATAAWAQRPDGDDPLAFRTGVELVAIDVTVTDRQGQPLRGLGPEDFVVSVAGQPRRVVSAEFVDRTAPLQAAPDPEVLRVSTNEGAPSGRIFVFVVDQNTLETGGARRVASGARHLLARLTPADRSAVVVLPLGPNVELTWAHHEVREALERVGGFATVETGWEFGSMSEARDIAGQNLSALRMIAERECGRSGGPTGTAASGGGGAPPSEGAPGGGGPGRGTEGGEGGGSGPSRGGGGATGGFVGGFSDSGDNQCARNLKTQAEMAWRSAESVSLSSLTALRQTLAALARVGGDKTMVLISGGWPLHERDQLSLLGMVAAEAAAARVTVFPFFVPASMVSASRRIMTRSPVADEQMHGWPLDTLASMTGGAAFRAQVGAEMAFDRLALEMSGHYRVGVERTPADRDGKPRKLEIQVSRGGTNVRAREIFDVPTYEDRNWSARLENALMAPAVMTGVGLRLTSYVTADRDDTSRVRLRLTGEALRLHDGDATFQFVIRDATGRQLVSEEQYLGSASGDRLPFSVDVPVTPGTYAVRLAVMDSAGRVGSVDHRTDAHRIALGPLSGFGPLLVRVPGEPGATPMAALEGVRHGERLAVQIDLSAGSAPIDDADVLFEIASTTDGPALVQLPGAVSVDALRQTATADVIADVRLLPPGRYVVRARVLMAGDELGELRRPFEITGPSEAAAALVTPGGAPGAVPGRLSARVAGVVPAFAVDRVLTPHVLTTFLDRVAARPDASAPGIRELLDRARAPGGLDAVVPETVRSESPALAAFLSGLSLLAQRKLDPAADAFRTALRASPDFYPAMVYLGACYAAGGKDREAAGAWRTALIKEGDAVTLHALLAEALMRQGSFDMAFDVLGRARGRWPEEQALQRQFALAAVSTGRYVDGLDTIEALVEHGHDDPQVLELALLVLYESASTGQPVVGPEEDRLRMTRFADAYRARRGPSLALVERWLSALDPK